MNWLNRLSLYYHFSRNMRKAYPHLKERYNFTKNLYSEYYTVLDLSEAPDIVKNEYGIYWKENEINRFVLLIKKELKQYDIYDELGVLEIKPLNDTAFGICFGIKPLVFKPRFFVYGSILISILGLLTLFII